ncbi:hypothetical protein ACQPZX_11870 [Actinoplanes sp. CA-142083]|uniref:hypothetical protein n=1 Tax=Actinoplanes sp. CA-142083 TaxID=3239903 RepID=UPI003D93BB01
MTGPIDSSGLTGMLGEVVAALSGPSVSGGAVSGGAVSGGAVSGGAVSGGAASGGAFPDGVGEGEGAEGRIRVRAVMPGRIEGLELDPQLMRWPHEELAREIESAVNGALASLQSQAATGAAGLDGLTEQLKEIQLSAERRFTALTASLVEAQEQLVRRAEGR